LSTDVKSYYGAGGGQRATHMGFEAASSVGCVEGHTPNAHLHFRPQSPKEFAKLGCEIESRNDHLWLCQSEHLDQQLTGQLATLKAAGTDPIYREKISGVRADRPQLAKLMASLQAGDVVVVTKLDRLGRSTRELLDLIERIGKAGASFRSIGDPLWDTGSSQGPLLSTMLAAIAEFERELIRERTGEGRRRAMGAGVKFGRKPKLSDFQRQEAIKRRAAGERLADIAKSYAVDISMISRLEA
jgi:DNA invertase Pin-like site-specific DNA recombinase